LQQYTTHDAHAPARESDKVSGWLVSSVSASLNACVSASVHASHDADGNNNAHQYHHPHHATDSRDSQQCQYHLTPDHGIGTSTERAREGGGAGEREHDGGRPLGGLLGEGGERVSKRQRRLYAGWGGSGRNI